MIRSCWMSPCRKQNKLELVYFLFCSHAILLYIYFKCILLLLSTVCGAKGCWNWITGNRQDKPATEKRSQVSSCPYTHTNRVGWHEWKLKMTSLRSHTLMESGRVNPPRCMIKQLDTHPRESALIWCREEFQTAGKLLLSVVGFNTGNQINIYHQDIETAGLRQIRPYFLSIYLVKQSNLLSGVFRLLNQSCVYTQ